MVNFTRLVQNRYLGIILNKPDLPATFFKGTIVILTKDYTDPKAPDSCSQFLKKGEVFAIIESGYYECLIDDENKVVELIGDTEWCKIEIGFELNDPCQDCVDGFVRTADLRLIEEEEFSNL